MTTSWVEVRPGRVVRLHEQDYQYGVGWLRLRVTSVGDPELHGDGWWIPVSGMAVDGDGRDIDVRHVSVRAVALSAGPHRQVPASYVIERSRRAG